MNSLKVNQRVFYSSPEGEQLKACVKKLWKSGKTATITDQNLKVRVVDVTSLTPVDTPRSPLEESLGLESVRVKESYPNQSQTSKLSTPTPRYYWREDDPHTLSLRLFVDGGENDPYCEDVDVLVNRFRELVRVKCETLAILLVRGDDLPVLSELVDISYKMAAFFRRSLARLGLSQSEIQKRLGDAIAVEDITLTEPDQEVDQEVRVKESYPNQETFKLSPPNPETDYKENKKPSTRWWYEEKFINKKGKQCGPYYYIRWEENGHRRSKYYGKNPPPPDLTF